MFKTKRVFSNELTRQISDNKLTIEQVLLHKELSVSLRNEADPLINFLFSQENYQILIDYALFDKKTESLEFQHLQINQINKNAASVLSYATSEVKKQISQIKNGDEPFLLQKLKEFIENETISHNPLYAGHFQRIYANILRDPNSDFEDFFKDDFVEQLIPFISKNILILPYKELLETLLEDIIDKMGEETIHKILNIILQHATFYSYVTYYQSSSNNISLIDKYRQSLQYFQKEKQPINKNGDPTPTPIISDSNPQKEKAQPPEKIINFFPKEYQSKNPNEFDFEEAQRRAYLYLSIIYQSFLNNGDTESLKNIEFAEMLLVCGVFSHEDSLSSMEAFKILVSLRDGFYDEDPYEDEDFTKLIDEYAEYISYSSDYLTNQAVSAFPLFWNHLYNNSTDDEPFFVNIDPVLNMEKYHIFPDGLTPFLILRPFLLSEPPISDRLNYSYVKIFEKLANDFNKLVAENDKDIQSYDPETQEQIRTIHFIIIEFLLRKFPYNNDYLNFFNALYCLIPDFPKNEYDAKNAPDPVRTPLNGAAFNICNLILTNNFFIINDKASLLLQDIEKEIENNVLFDLLDYEKRIPIRKLDGIEEEEEELEDE